MPCGGLIDHSGLCPSAPQPFMFYQQNHSLDHEKCQTSLTVQLGPIVLTPRPVHCLSLLALITWVAGLSQATTTDGQYPPTMTTREPCDHWLAQKGLYDYSQEGPKPAATSASADQHWFVKVLQKKSLCRKH